MAHADAWHIVKTMAVVAMTLLSSWSVSRAEPILSFSLAQEPSFEETYKSIEAGDSGLLITTDAAFDTVLRATGGLVRAAEMGALRPRLLTLLMALKLECARAEETASPGPEKEAATLALGYVVVAKALLEGEVDATELPGGLASRVSGELELVEKHEGYAFSPLFDHKEDYSQYVPRGHYAATPELQSYFRAMMWLGRRMFRVEEMRPQGAGMPMDRPELEGWHSPATEFPAAGLREVRAYLTLANAIERNAEAKSHYTTLVTLLKSLFGGADDLGLAELQEYSKVTNVAPESWVTVSDSQVAALARAAADAARDSTRIDATGLGRLGFVLLGQSTTFDSEVLQRLVHREDQPMNYTGTSDKQPFSLAIDDNRGPLRGFPMGLDLMAVLGSPRAKELLKSQGDTDYRHYEESLKSLQQDFALWRGTNGGDALGIHGGILLSIAAQFDPLPDSAPMYTRDPLWQDKALLSGLGAWTSLRHSTLLYAKQSATSVERGFDIPPSSTGMRKPVRVEPRPDVFARLEELLAGIDGRLTGANAFPELARPNVESLRVWLGILTSAARSERNGASLPVDLQDQLQSPSARIADALTWPVELTDSIGGPIDKDAALVADVHTRMPLVLEEALGAPLMVTVREPGTDTQGKANVYTGAVFTYYEFKQPLSNRLTDQAWRNLLRGGNAPPMPAWLESMIR